MTSQKSSASKECKALGIKSLAHACKVAGVHHRTAQNWYIHKPKLFKVFLHGVRAVDSTFEVSKINLE